MWALCLRPMDPGGAHWSGLSVSQTHLSGDTWTIGKLSGNLNLEGTTMDVSGRRGMSTEGMHWP